MRGKMGCSLMTLTFASSNELQTLCAETNVVLELTEDPTWQAGAKAGKGDLLRVNTQLNEMLVRGNASMRLPADEFASNLTPASPGQKIKPPSKPGTNQFA